MKLKKSLSKIIIIGSIFFISSMSFGGFISLQDDSLNNFWIVKKLDLSFIGNTYAESGGSESGGSRSYSKESGDYRASVVQSNTTNSTVSSVINNNVTSNTTCKTLYDTITTASGQQIKEPRKVCDTVATTNVAETVKLKVKKQAELTSVEKNNIKDRFNKVDVIIDKKYSSDSMKLNTYKKLNSILEEKISTLELIKSKINDELLFEKYEKKILLFSELLTLTQEKVLAYIDSIDLAAQQAAQAKAEETARIAAQQAAQAKAEETARIAAQQAAQAKASTTTSAS